MSTLMQALEPLLQFGKSILFLPWTTWEKVKETLRLSISLNGYTAINPDGVLAETEPEQDEEEEGETKE